MELPCTNTERSGGNGTEMSTLERVLGELLKLGMAFNAVSYFASRHTYIIDRGRHAYTQNIHRHTQAEWPLCNFHHCVEVCLLATTRRHLHDCMHNLIIPLAVRRLKEQLICMYTIF